MNQPGLAASFVDAELGMGKEAQQNVRNLVLPWMPPKEATSAPPFMLPTPPPLPHKVSLWQRRQDPTLRSGMKGKGATEDTFPLSLTL